MTPLARLMSRITYAYGSLPTPCWISGYAHNGVGYTCVATEGRRVLCHRFTYELFVGPIPDGLVLDHLCRVPRCCNPAHLEPVTNRENLRRGNSPQALATRTNECKFGHSLVDAYESKGSRYCRTCTKRRHEARSIK